MRRVNVPRNTTTTTTTRDRFLRFDYSPISFIVYFGDILLILFRDYAATLLALACKGKKERKERKKREEQRNQVVDK